MVKVTNNSQARQGVWFGGELVWIGVGGSHDADMTGDELALIEKHDNLETEGAPTDQPTPSASADAVNAAREEVRQSAQAHIDDLKQAQADALKAANDRADAADAKAADLQKALNAANSQIVQLQAPAPVVKLPGLTGKSKADLLAIAAAEAVTEFTVDDGTAKPIADGTNNDIVAAIEAKREPAA